MILTAKDIERLSRKRVALAKATKKDSFSMFSLGQKKATTNINFDPLSKAERTEINKAKERINCHYDDEYDDPFFDVD